MGPIWPRSAFVIFRGHDRQKTEISDGSNRPSHSNPSPFLMMKRLFVLGALVLALTAPAAGAQRASHRSSGQIELGIDGGITFGLDDPTFTVVALPTQSFRLGYFLSDNVEIEPRFSINSVSVSGGSLTLYSLEGGVLFQPHGDRVGNGLYLRPFAGFSGVSVSGPGDSNSGHAGVGLGVKLPFADRRLATRMEANYAHGFSGGGTNTIGVLIGLSFFTR